MDDSSSGGRATTGPDPDVGNALAGDRTAFTSVTGAFYRGTIDRMTTWRTRLDQTTNWAVVVMAAILTWSFSSTDNPHYVLLVGMAVVVVFLLVETNRFQEYDAWRARIRLLEGNLLANVYRPDGTDRPDWRDRLSDDLRGPAIRLSFLEALTHRLRRVYLYLLTVLLAAWLLRVTVFGPSEPLDRAAAVGAVPGLAVVAVVGAGYAVLVVLVLWSLRGPTRVEFDEDDRER